ncbi:MAG: 4-hydroxy-3-methylbut-2-enyl diphosphate reductase [Candidatus Eremiobacteraeota bacterium]|nr:4-hydroxy-3-methylbut-2-enyl diphosphate reductase [Candidatus Eremiobacteraeota bacterium]
MNIIIADKAGFCFGVKRAIRMAYEELEKANGRPVYTLGSLVHNPQVIEKLEDDKIKSIEELDDYPVGHLLIRTHGVSPSTRKRAEELGYKIVDATCPLVKKIHTIVFKLKEWGYKILVIGHSSHPEVEGIVGEVEKDCKVIDSVEDAKSLENYTKLGVVVQTTALWSKFREIAGHLPEKAQECRIFNTICHATIERQDTALKLAKETGVMIIVGGKKSSNTRRLLEICRSVNPNSHQVEYTEELQPEWFHNVEEVGVTAGASTPDHIIRKIVENIKNIGTI